MKFLTITRRAAALAAVLGGLAFTAISCKDNDADAVSYGTVSGVVTDSEGMPVEGVRVTVSDTDGEVLTAADGSYTFAGVSNVRHAVIAAKAGYLAASKTVTARSFIGGEAKDVDLSILYANTTLSGRVLDQRGGTRSLTRAVGTPLQGVVVQVATGERTTTDADGRWELRQLAAMDHVVTFTYNDYPPVKVNVPLGKQVDEAFETGEIYLGGSDLLADFDRYELAEAPLLLYDDYRAGNANLNTEVYGFGDWSTALMAAAIAKHGNFIEYQSEGLALRPSDDGVGRPNDLENFDAFIYGRKKIVANNCFLTVRVRCHQAPATFGVQVIDLNAPNPTIDRVGTYTHPNDNYANYNFDLSDYVGKEVLVVVGQYIDYTNGGDANKYWHQLPVARLTFSSDYLVGDAPWWPGTEVVPGWKLTKEMIVNAGVQNIANFNGRKPTDNADNNHYGISLAYGTNHIAAHWHLIAITKDLEPIRTEGFIMKTSNSTPKNVDVPASFIYAKFNIAEGANKMVVQARTFSDNNQYFKFAAFDEQGNLLGYIMPTATAGEAAEASMWKFSRNNNDYASFEYDLSAYNGRTITVALGVMKGEAIDEEGKFTVGNIELQ